MRENSTGQQMFNWWQLRLLPVALQGLPTSTVLLCSLFIHSCLRLNYFSRLSLFYPMRDSILSSMQGHWGRISTKLHSFPPLSPVWEQPLPALSSPVSLFLRHCWLEAAPVLGGPAQRTWARPLGISCVDPPLQHFSLAFHALVAWMCSIQTHQPLFGLQSLYLLIPLPKALPKAPS